jgi:hypothetical protein
MKFAHNIQPAFILHPKIDDGQIRSCRDRQRQCLRASSSKVHFPVSLFERLSQPCTECLIVINNEC